MINRSDKESRNMTKIYETEPFACAYLNSEIDDAEYRIACGMRETARFIPLEI